MVSTVLVCGSSLVRQALVLHLEFPFAIADRACFLNDKDLVTENPVFNFGSSIFQITVVMKFYGAFNLRIKLSSNSFKLMNLSLYLKIFMDAAEMLAKTFHL